jgi:hypothetical protein
MFLTKIRNQIIAAKTTSITQIVKGQETEKSTSTLRISLEPQMVIVSLLS